MATSGRFADTHTVLQLMSPVWSTVNLWCHAQIFKTLTDCKLVMYNCFHQSLPGEVHETSQRKQTFTIVGMLLAQQHVQCQEQGRQALNFQYSQASKEWCKNMSKLLVTKLMLQLHKLRKSPEQKCGKEWLLSKTKQSKPGRLIIFTLSSGTKHSPRRRAAKP